MKHCILNTSSLIHAQLAKSKLESCGIFCEIRTNDACGNLPHLRLIEGVQIYVSEKDMERSLELLKEENE